MEILNDVFCLKKSLSRKLFMNKNPVSLSINPTGCVDGKGGGALNSLSPTPGIMLYRVSKNVLNLIVQKEC